MVFAGPGLADPAVEHGADRALDPDAGVDMDDDAEDQHPGGEGMEQRGEADELDAE
ncbi:hypothetical protein D3C85_1606070 [compost metagenome]